MIEVERTSVMPDGWGFRVRIVEEDGNTEHRVTVSRADYERLTHLAVQPEALVQKAFEFLLAQETKESILHQFDLAVVAEYFPDFEREITRGMTS